MSALKALRFIFSLERNRGKFKKLFTPSLFEKFIDVGHYNRQCSPYEEIIEDINKLNVMDFIQFDECNVMKLI